MRGLVGLALGGLILAELVLRFGFGFGDPPRVVRDAAVEYRLAPNASYTRYGNKISINALGMRAPDPAPDAALRVLLIGDSVIYGNHFLDQSETIAAHLAQDLQKSGCAAAILPAAASSWGPVNQAAFLTDIGPVQADVAILLVSAHDLFDTPTFDDRVIPYRLAPTYGAIHDVMQIVWDRFAPAPQTRASASIETRQRDTRLALNAMARQMAADGTPLILVYHPTVPEQTAGPLPAKAAFEDWAARMGVEVAALKADLTAQDYRDSIHPNAQGAQKIATRFAQILQTHGIACR